MRRITAVIFALTVVFATLPAFVSGAPAPTPAAQDSFKRAALREGWPDTREGDLASRWVRAFSTGEAALREFNTKELSKESLAKKSMDERIANYRKLKERFGTLSLGSVVKQAPGELTVKLLDADAASHEFVFALEKAAPFKLVSVSMKEMQSMHGMFGH